MNGTDETSDRGARHVARIGRVESLAHRAIGGLVRMGAGPSGCHELSVVGRRTGRVHATPVNVLDHAGARFLVSPRGATQWVRNVRVDGDVTLRRGRRREHVRLVEVADARRPELLRAYLERWHGQVSSLVDGLRPESSDAEFAAAAPGFPVFEVRARD